MTLERVSNILQDTEGVHQNHEEKNSPNMQKQNRSNKNKGLHWFLKQMS